MAASFKHYIFCAAGAAVFSAGLILSAADELGPEMVKNGQFSGEFSGGVAKEWRVTGTNCGTASQENAIVVSKPSAQRMEIKDNFNLRQDLSLSPGKTYKISAKVRIIKTADNKPLSIMVNKIVIANTKHTSPSDDFETIEGLWKQPAGEIDAALYIGPVRESYSGVYIVDDVSCREVLAPGSAPGTAKKGAAALEHDDKADLKKLIPASQKNRIRMSDSVAAILAGAEGEESSEDALKKEREIDALLADRPEKVKAGGEKPPAKDNKSQDKTSDQKDELVSAQTKSPETQASAPAAPQTESSGAKAVVKFDAPSAPPGKEPPKEQTPAQAAAASQSPILTDNAMKFKSLNPLASQNQNIKRVDSILASVDGEPISLMDVIFESGKEEARIAAVFSGRDLWDETKKARKKTLDDIIARKLIFNDYKNKPFEIPKQYFEDMLDQLAMEMADGTRPGLEKKAKKFGVSMDELKEKAKVKVVCDMMVADYFQRNIILTPREIHDYYKQHEQEFLSPAQSSLDLIFISRYGRHRDNFDKLASEISADLKSGKADIFHSLAIVYSDAPNAEKGGVIGWIDDSKIRPEFAKVLAGAAPGFISGPAATSEGVYFIRLADRKEAEKTEFGKLENNIRKRIEDKMKADAFKAYNEKLKRDAIIRYYF